MIRFYEPEALATVILYFNDYMNYHLSLALRVSLSYNEPEALVTAILYFDFSNDLPPFASASG